MKILHIITRSQWGGAQKIVCELAESQMLAGNTVVVMCGEKGRLTEVLLAHGISVKENPYLRRAPGLADGLALYRIWREIRQGYDIVHAHSTKAGILSRVLRIKGGFRICFTVHGFGVTGEHPAWLQVLYHRLERFLAAFTDGLIFVSQADCQTAEKKGWLKRARRFCVIHNGILSSLAGGSKGALETGPAVRGDLGVPADGFLIGNLARAVWVKNPEFWLQAAESYLRENEKAYFVWFGAGPELASMRKQVQGMDVTLRSHFVFPGEVEGGDGIVESLDVLFLSSRSEGMPLVVLEGMQKKRAILAPALPGLCEVLGTRGNRGEETEDGRVAGLLYEPGNLRNVLAALRQLEDPDYRRVLGQEGNARVHSEYSADRMALEYEELYRSISSH